ncbi:uncharacterized protein LOC114175339 [Vigna unguiculata]|uniref:uncharacterized protein LOC114175339 n=1 Tax=Vigna unguiculata TaxID=3917 RepID=UPI001015DA3F|nr:uncharacterized protein LOC114175339 [Vigna unguiculata]
MNESFGANEGGHPSRQSIHASGNFPFTQFILETPLPERWKMPTFEKYNGTTNPDNHMPVFTHQMMFHVVSDPIWCRVFSTSLTGEALEWFSKLSANSIDSFATLKARFSMQFAPLRPTILTVDNLVNIRQEDGESLRSYLNRYNCMSIKIKDLSDEIVRHHFSYGLQPGVFTDKISRKKSKTMEEMRERATKFIQMEDMQEFMEAFSADSLPASRKKPPPPDVDGSNHCQYHQTIGHTTEECHTLRNKIEELICQGHLKKYIQQDHPQRSSVRNEARHEDRPQLSGRSDESGSPIGEGGSHLEHTEARGGVAIGARINP